TSWIIVGLDSENNYANGHGWMWIDNTELPKITNTGTFTIGGVLTQYITVDGVSYSGGASHFNLWSIGDVAATVVIVSQSSITATSLVDIESNTDVTFTGGLD